MQILFNCKNCEKKYSVGSMHAGKRAKCKECGQIIQVPTYVHPQQKTLKPKKSRRNLKNLFRNKKIIYLISLLFLMIGILGGWHYYINQPNYALQQVKKSLNTKNRLLFEKYIKLDLFCDDLVDELLDGYLKVDLSDKNDESGWGAIGSMLGLKMVDGMKSPFSSSIKSVLIKTISSGSLDNIWNKAFYDSSNVGLTPLVLLNSAGLDGHSKLTFDKIVKFENRAYLPIKINDVDLGAIFTIQIELQRDNKTWQIVGVEDLAESISERTRLQEELIKRANIKIQKYLSSFVEFGDLNKIEVGESYFGPKFIYLSCHLKNVTNMKIISGFISIQLPGNLDDRSIEFLITNPIAPYSDGLAEYGLEYNSFIDWHDDVRNISEKFINPKFLRLVYENNGEKEIVNYIFNWSEYVRLDEKFK